MLLGQVDNVSRLNDKLYQIFCFWWCYFSLNKSCMKQVASNSGNTSKYQCKHPIKMFKIKNVWSRNMLLLRLGFRKIWTSVPHFPNKCIAVVQVAYFFNFMNKMLFANGNICPATYIREKLLSRTSILPVGFNSR